MEATGSGSNNRTEQPGQLPARMRGVLLGAGVYNLAWGVFIYNFPDAFYSWLRAEVGATAGDLIIYQGAGTFIFGILYILSALYPVRFWYIIFIGFLSKLVGAVGAYFLIVDRNITDHFIFHVLVNDLAWVVPLALIAYRAYVLQKFHTYEKIA